MIEPGYAERRLKRGAEYPYDAPDDWRRADENEVPPPAPDWAHAAARGVLADLGDRQGIKSSLWNIEDEIRAEIVSTLALIIRAAHEGQP